MKKTSFAIVGSGWRSLYFVRIAKALPERFELRAMLMDGMAAYAADASDAPYPLADALEDAWTAVLMKRSIMRNETVHSEPMPWHA